MKKFKNGFTLAEVLITLGVIGVVAAMTMPAVIQNWQKQAWTTQLKKSYSILNQGFQKMLADEGVNLLSQTSVFNSINNGNANNDCRYSNAVTSVQCSAFLEHLGKYFKFVEIKKFEISDNYDIFHLSGEPAKPAPTASSVYTYNAIILSDGTMIYKYYFNNRASGYKKGIMKGYIGDFWIDINGTKGPNKRGRDIFRFYIGDNGLVYPEGSRAVSEAHYHIAYHTEDFDIMYWRNDGSCENNGTSNGEGCAARVLEVGKMDY
ncbi:prepilin-type N-terminal cleavage/methylation domain-containing protein [bacterium]|nr:prepilin-type N-terminal cleavage/methylation domain-containing protein [bacterium]